MLFFRLGKILISLKSKFIKWLSIAWQMVGKWLNTKWKEICKWFSDRGINFKLWLASNLQPLTAAVLILVLIYLVSFTLLQANKERAIIGIALQILTGVILVFDQIASHSKIKKQVKKIVEHSQYFAFLITIILLPFGISFIMGLHITSNNKYSTAVGITLFIIFTYGMFLSSLTLLRKIKWLQRKDYVPVDKDKFDISDLSIRNVEILFGISLLLAFLIGYLLDRFYLNNQYWVKAILLFIITFFAFTIFPLLIISPLYFLGFLFAKITQYLTKKNLNIWFWIFLFFIWAWGGLLLLINACS